MKTTLLMILAVAGGLTSAVRADSATQPSAAVVTEAARELASKLEVTPPKPVSISDRIKRGVDFLVSSQQPDGSWGKGTETRGTEIYHMVPGSHDAFRVGTTALCLMALRHAGETKAHDRALEYLINHGSARRDDGSLLYNIWAHVYATEALSIEMRNSSDPRIAAAAKLQLNDLVRYAAYMGGWNYYDFDAHTQAASLGATSFGTAAGLVALWEAKQSKLEVPQKLLEMSLHRLAECRLPNGVFLYGSDYKYSPRLPANMPRGAVGRTQPGVYALWLWSHPGIGESEATQALDLFFKEHDGLEMGRKRPYPHESWYQTSGYYYYFDHYYASRMIERLSLDRRKMYAGKLSDVVAPHQEPDGSWWDYAMWDYHKPYGTAFAIMTLLQCDAMMTLPSRP